MHRLSLRSDLFLLAHDDAGKPVRSEAGIGAGLAGATLVELLLGGRVVVSAGRLDVRDPSPTGDDETDATIDAIAANTAPCGPRAWVSWISHGAYGRVAEILATAGVVRRRTVRRLGVLPAPRWVACDMEDLVRARARVRYAVHGGGPVDARTAALCGLVRVLRIESSLLLSDPPGDLLLALYRIAETADTPVRQVTNAVDTVITAATYR
jgi:hypothetical protein